MSARRWIRERVERAARLVNGLLRANRAQPPRRPGEFSAPPRKGDKPKVPP